MQSKYEVIKSFIERLETYLVKKYKSKVTIDNFDFNVDLFLVEVNFDNGFNFRMEIQHQEVLDVMYDRKIIDRIDGYILDDFTRSLYTENGLGKMHQFESKKQY